MLFNALFLYQLQTWFFVFSAINGTALAQSLQVNIVIQDETAVLNTSLDEYLYQWTPKNCASLQWYVCINLLKTKQNKKL